MDAAGLGTYFEKEPSLTLHGDANLALSFQPLAQAEHGAANRHYQLASPFVAGLPERRGKGYDSVNQDLFQFQLNMSEEPPLSSLGNRLRLPHCRVEN